MGAVELTLPYPPTVNHYWEPIYARRGQKRQFGFKVGRRGVAYRRHVGNIVMSARLRLNAAHRPSLPIPAPVLLVVDVFPPDDRRRDIDNLLKALNDSITHSGLIADDFDIATLIVRRREKRPGGAVHISARTAAPALADE